MKKIIVLLFFSNLTFSQTFNLNSIEFTNQLRYLDLDSKISIENSFNILPITLNDNSNLNNLPKHFLNYQKNIINRKNISLNILPFEYIIDYNSHHPYNRNNGSMIPNKGYQHIVSMGFNFEIGPLNIIFKPEHHFSENKDFEGFWEGHYDEIWHKRYKHWNKIDTPERFGDKRHNRILLGQSKISLKYSFLELAFSNENIWWGPSMRNSIMMSNHAEGFRHISLKTNRPIQTKIGNFEWQLITGRLEKSGHLPPGSERTYGGTNIYVPKINQNSKTDDWRYLQGYILKFRPKFSKGLSIGFIRWVQMYSALIKGKYVWMDGSPTYFPIFSNLFRSNDKSSDYEAQTNQAAGLYFKWKFEKSKSEIYAEFHHNDSKYNVRDFILDSDHSRAFTAGLSKIFNYKEIKFFFNWEWTQMEQTASRLVRNAGHWYEHGYVMDGYTNKGEVLGSAIGPGSNSHYFSLSLIQPKNDFSIGFEILDVDNDFFYEAFASARDFRRYWKDLSLDLKLTHRNNKFWLSSNLVFTRSLNYQWELDDFALPYYHSGRDVNNFHFKIKLLYFWN